MSSEPSNRSPDWLQHPAPRPAASPHSHGGASRFRLPDLAWLAGGRRRLVAIGVAGAAVAAFVGLLAALPRWGEEEWAPGDAIDRSRVLRPIATSADPETGERIAPFEGFAVSVETEPPGALVLVGGVPRGEAPVLAGVDCRPGAIVQIRAERAGLRPARATTRCRSDTLVKLVVRLQP